MEPIDISDMSTFLKLIFASEHSDCRTDMHVSLHVTPSRLERGEKSRNITRGRVVRHHMFLFFRSTRDF